MRVWVCSNCGTPVELREIDGEDGVHVFCTGDDPGCTPREDRHLLCDRQVRAIEVPDLIRDRDDLNEVLSWQSVYEEEGSGISERGKELRDRLIEALGQDPYKPPGAEGRLR